MIPAAQVLAALLLVTVGRPQCVELPAVNPPAGVSHIRLASTDLWMVAVSDTIVYVCTCEAPQK
jgi:hypothetical protein